eukprot:6872399-Karenia_brevis.AAC.1
MAIVAFGAYLGKVQRTLHFRYQTKKIPTTVDENYWLQIGCGRHANKGDHVDRSCKFVAANP